MEAAAASRTTDVTRTSADTAKASVVAGSTILAMSERRPSDGLAQRITGVRTALGLSKREFARRLGITRNTMITYERRQSTPRLETVRRIARAAGLTVDELIDGDVGSWDSGPDWHQAVALLRAAWRDPSQRTWVIRWLRSLA